MTDKKHKHTPDLLKSVREEGVARIFFLFILSSFIFALIVVAVRVAFDEGFRITTEYRVILFQLTAGVVFLRLPRLLSRPLSIFIPDGLYIAYMLFLWGAIFLGEFALFYYRVGIWDTVLHFYSAILLSILGLSIPRLITGEDISPTLSVILALAFSVFVGVLWEIYEFSFDGILGLNMQKFAHPMGDGKKLSPLVGRAALVDTMTDLIIDLFGSISASVWAYFYIKRKGMLPKALVLTRIR